MVLFYLRLSVWEHFIRILWKILLKILCLFLTLDHIDDQFTNVQLTLVSMAEEDLFPTYERTIMTSAKEKNWVVNENFILSKRLLGKCGLIKSFSVFPFLHFFNKNKYWWIWLFFSVWGAQHKFISGWIWSASDKTLFYASKILWKDTCI